MVAEGGCRRCAYRKRLEGDFLCPRCREDRDIDRDQKRPDAIDAAAIDEFAAQPERVHKASNLDCGLSPWNARPKPEPTVAYWSPLPDPEPKSAQEWRHSISDNGWRLLAAREDTRHGKLGMVDDDFTITLFSTLF